jgi:hypothetical protein
MRNAALALAILAFPAVASAQPPRIVKGTVTTVAASGDLAAQVRGAHTPYVGYSVPEIDGHRVMCCFEKFGEFRSGGTCSLGAEGSFFSNDDDDAPVRSASAVFAVFYRGENGAIIGVHNYSMDCTLDANGVAITWIEGVDQRKSVALVASLIGGSGRHADRMMATLAMHADPSATTELERLLRSAAVSDELRGHAAFWLGQTRGRRGYEDVLAVARLQSAGPRLREKAVFALSQSQEPQAVDELIALAKSDPTPKVREQALFWLSQKAGKKAAGAIRDAVDHDPEEGVREKAVFAVSQLPDAQSVPMLIDLMKSHRDPGVRKKAAFWLGQKDDPRALAAIEDVLKR